MKGKIKKTVALLMVFVMIFSLGITALAEGDLTLVPSSDSGEVNIEGSSDGEITGPGQGDANEEGGEDEEEAIGNGGGEDEGEADDGDNGEGEGEADADDGEEASTMRAYEILYLLEEIEEEIHKSVRDIAQIGEVIEIPHPEIKGYQVLPEQPEELVVSEDEEENAIVVYYEEIVSDDDEEVIEEEIVEAIELIDEETGVSIFAESGVLPVGATLNVVQISQEETQEYLDELSENEGIELGEALAFDITLFDEEGNEVQPEGEVTVSFSDIEFEEETEEVLVYHVVSEEEQAENSKNTYGKGSFRDSKREFKAKSAELFKNKDSKNNKGLVKFKTDHFSIYIVGTPGVYYGDQNSRYNVFENETIELFEDGGWDTTTRTWSTDNSNVAEIITMNGRNATIKAKKTGDVLIKCVRGVTTNNFYLRVWKGMDVDETAELVTTVASRGKWTSNNENVAKVVENPQNYKEATVKAEGPGTAVIKYEKTGGNSGTSYYYIEVFEKEEDDDDNQAGELQLSKKKFATDDRQIWEIELEVGGTATTNTSDIVLVIDRSGSMAGNRLANAKIAAKSFVNTLLEDSSLTRIALVTFDNSATEVFSFTTNKDNLNTKIEAIKAGGGTNIQAGLEKADDLLSKSTAKYRNIVLLGDGEATYSYSINNVNSYLVDWIDSKKITSENVPYDKFSSTRVGNGEKTHTLISGKNYYSHGNSAISIAKHIRSKSTDELKYAIYTIALDAGFEGYRTLKKIANPGKYYETTNPTDLNEIFGQIAGRLIHPAKDVEVTDPIGHNFTLKQGGIYKIDVNTGTASYKNGVITWDFWPEGATDIVSPAKMTYYVRLDNDAPSGTHDTNGDTTINYKDPDGENKKGKFDPIPNVTVSRVYYDANGGSNPPQDEKFYIVDLEENATVLNEGDMTNAGYRFTGWNTQADGEGTPHVAGDEITMDAFDVTLYAQWKPIVTIIVTANSNSKEYDGTSLSDSGYTYEGNLAGGDCLVVAVEGTITNAGEEPNKVKSVKVMRREGDDAIDVTENYNIGTSVDGTLTVNKRLLELTAASASKVYDGTALTKNEYNITSGSLVEGQTLASVTVTGSQTGVGTSANVASGALIKDSETDVTGNYAITYVDGTLEVTKGEGTIIVTANSNSKEYDGTSLSDSGYTYEGNLAEGDCLVVAVEGTITNAGEEPNKVKSVKVMRGEGDDAIDVTENYNIGTSVDGTLTVNKRLLELTAASASKVYDGTALTKNEYNITSGSLVEGHTSSATVEGSQTAVGSSPNRITDVRITAKVENNSEIVFFAIDEGLVDEIDVTENYAITCIDGKLTVSAKSTPPVRPPSGGGGGGSSRPRDPEIVVVPEEEIPADLPKLNKEEHFQYIQGYPDGTVRPEGHITRDEVAAVFFRLLDAEYRESIRTTEHKFSDVAPERWSNTHIATLANGGIVTGYTDGTFKPNNYITRGEMATIASRFDKLSPFEKDSFSDIEGHWANKYINSAVKKGWINGYKDGTFKPDQYITRAEFVTLVNNVLERRVTRSEILPKAKQFPDLPEDKWYYEAMQEAINSHHYERLENGYETWTEIYYPELEM